MCEEACAELSACVAFQYTPRSGRCELFDACASPVATPGKVLVSKTAVATCNVTVAGAELPAAIAASCGYDMDDFADTECDLNGVYDKVSATEYVKPGSTSKIFADPTQPCFGWVLAANVGNSSFAANYSVVYRTFANGSATAPLGGVPGLGVARCTRAPAYAYSPPARLMEVPIYGVAAEEAEGVGLSSVCGKEARGPVLTTCVQSPEFQQYELGLLYGSAPLTSRRSFSKSRNNAAPPAYKSLERTNNEISSRCE